MLKIFSIVLLLATKWDLKVFSKVSSPPTLYFRLASARGVEVQLFRKSEKSAVRLAEKLLDEDFFQTCLDLQLCPKFLKFRPPNLRTYEDVNSIYHQVIQHEIKVLRDEKATPNRVYNEYKDSILNVISITQGICLLTVLCDMLKTN